MDADVGISGAPSQHNDSQIDISAGKDDSTITNTATDVRADGVDQQRRIGGPLDQTPKSYTWLSHFTSNEMCNVAVQAPPQNQI